MQALRAVQQKVHVIKQQTDESNDEHVIKALKELCIQEVVLIDFVAELEQSDQQGPKQGLLRLANQLIDRLLSEITRLLEIVKARGGDTSSIKRHEKAIRREEQRKNERQKLATEQSQTQQQKVLPQQVTDTAGPPEVDPANIQLGDIIGKGAFGIVYKAEIARNIVAAKVPKKQNLTDSELQSFKHEVAVMKGIYHQNVVLFIGASTQPNNFIILTELMETDVEQLLRPKDKSKKQHLTLYQKMKMAKDAALGITWLHDISNVIHRDLKLANLLVDKNGTVKVTDFGFSLTLKKMENIRTLPKGTALYMAPEVILQQPFNKTSDTYSFGLILWEMLTEEILFPQYGAIKPFVEAVCHRNERPPIPDNCLSSLKDLIVRCWNKDKNERPFFTQICDALNGIIVDTVIQKESGREFWKKYFLNGKNDLQEEVLWEDFIAAMSSELAISKINKGAPENEKIKYFYEKLKNIPQEELIENLNQFFNNCKENNELEIISVLKKELAILGLDSKGDGVQWKHEPEKQKLIYTLQICAVELEKEDSEDLGVSGWKKVLCTHVLGNKDIVEMKTFNLLQEWFGDFFCDPEIWSQMKLLFEVGIKQGWFHLDIGQDIVQRRLEHRPENTFLVRLSFSNPTVEPFTISKNVLEAQNTTPTIVIRHKRIARIDQRYSPNLGNQFSVIVGCDEILEYKTIVDLIHGLREIGNLGEPCPFTTVVKPDYPSGYEHAK